MSILPNIATDIVIILCYSSKLFHPYCHLNEWTSLGPQVFSQSFQIEWRYSVSAHHLFHIWYALFGGCCLFGFRRIEVLFNLIIDWSSASFVWFDGAQIRAKCFALLCFARLLCFAFVFVGLDFCLHRAYCTIVLLFYGYTDKVSPSLLQIIVRKMTYTK